MVLTKHWPRIMYLIGYLDRYIDQCIGQYLTNPQPTRNRHVDGLLTDVLVELPLILAEVSTVTILGAYRSTTGGISVNYRQNVGRVSFDS